MKHSALIFIFLFIISINCQAQIITLQTGPTFSNLDWNINDFGNAGLDEVVTGFGGYLGINYLDKKYFSISTNLGFMQKGGKQTVVPQVLDPMDDGDLVRRAFLNYVSFNTTLDIKYPLKKNIFPYLSVGPRLDYLLSYSSEFNNDVGDNNLKDFSYGLITGLGVKFNMAWLQFGIKGDYLLNFNKIADWPPSDNTTGGSIKDNTYLASFLVGYIIK